MRISEESRQVRCTREHIPDILRITNEVIANSTSLYEYRPRTVEMMHRWFDTKEQAGYPVLGYELTSGRLVGFASYGSFRAWPAYKYTVEHAVYVDSQMRGNGFGKLLLKDIVNTARADGYHTIIGGIDASNSVSIALHVSMGFEACGTVRHAGYKFGRWIDLNLYQYIFDGPPNPVEDAAD